MLEAAGLTPAQEVVYRFLIMAQGGTVEDVAARSELDEDQAAEVVAQLEIKGMIERSIQAPDRFSAVPPDLALLPLVQKQTAVLGQAHSAVLALADIYRHSSRQGAPSELLEVITGASAFRLQLQLMQDSVQEEMLWFCKAGHVVMPSASNRAELDALARGVRYHVIYEQDFLQAPGAIDDLVLGVEAGEVARSVPALPLRMAVADRSLAIFPLAPGSPHSSETEPRAALVRDSVLLDAFGALFDRYWEIAVPLRVAATTDASGFHGVADPVVLADADKRLLSLLIAGVADKSVARQLGVSRRTVQRRIQHLLDLTGAVSRMQLAWQAARRGWV